MPADPFESLAISLRNLKEMGLNKKEAAPLFYASRFFRKSTAILISCSGFSPTSRSMVR